jgi:hypothetical protein
LLKPDHPDSELGFPSGERLRRREAIVVRFMVSIEEVAKMGPVFLIVIGVTWAAILALGFLLLGALRALGLQGWRLEQLEVTTPSRVGRGTDRLKVTHLGAI